MRACGFFGRFGAISLDNPDPALFLLVDSKAAYTSIEYVPKYKQILCVYMYQ